MRWSQCIQFHIAFTSILSLLLTNSITGLNPSPYRTTSRIKNRATQNPQPQTSPSPTTTTQTRRTILSTLLTTTTTLLTPLLLPQPAKARTPGSKNITEAILQISDASLSLQTLQSDFDQYATTTPEGQAGNNTAAARRILGGIAPRAGQSAIEVAKVTPLYRLDNAFGVVTRAAIDGGESWEDRLDIENFEEIAERVLFAVQKADGDFYGVNFAAKGSVQVMGIYREAKEQVDRGVVDLGEMVRMLKDVGAPGL